MLTAPSFFSLILSLLGIFAYLFYIFQERNGIIGYCACLVGAFKRSSKFDLQGSEPPGGAGGGGGHGSVGGQSIGMNGRAMNGRYIGSESEHSESDSQGTTQHVDDMMYSPGGHIDNRLSVIPEHMEGAVEVSPMQLGNRRSSPPVQQLTRGPRGMAAGRTGMSFTVPVYMHSQDSDSEVTAGGGL
jgi:hypothetical protein